MEKGERIRSVREILLLVVVTVSLSTCSSVLAADGVAQDTATAKRSDVICLPILFYTPETKMAGGAAVSYYFRERGSDLRSRPSTIMPVVIYTQEKQIISELNGDLYWRNETFRLSGYVGYMKFPDKFYGIGNNTPEENEESYTPQRLILSVCFQKKMLPGLYLGIQYEFIESEMKEVEEEGLLVRKEIVGSQGGTVSALGVLLNWDTRNNIFYPTSGCFYQVSASTFGGGLGSDYGFTRYNLDVRQYLPVLSSHVVAFQGYMNIITGDPPFNMMSLFGGGELMRGYYEGRYRDKSMVAFQAEYRMPVWRRFGLACFLGVGDVSDTMSHFAWRDFKHSVGFGFRYLLSPEEKVNVRCDVAYGRHSSGFYITLLEAF